MVSKIPLSHILGPQHLRSIVHGKTEGRTGDASYGDLVLDVYTGWIVGLNFHYNVPTAEQYVSFVPLGEDPNDNTRMLVQAYQTVGVGGDPLTNAIAHVTVASFLSGPEMAAVDEAWVEVRPHIFPGIQGTQFALELNAMIAVQAGAIDRLSYNVTVLSQPIDQGSGALQEFEANKRALLKTEAP